MATPLKIVAQQCQDAYEQDFRGSTSFFVLQDFIFNAAATAAAIYQQMYREVYAQKRADGEKDEVVAFSNDFLSAQVLDVKKENGEVYAILKEQVFSFAYDQSQVGVQNVFCIKPAPIYELERSDVDELWQLQYLPKTNRIFWALEENKILIIAKGICNVSQIRVLYVPQINSNNPETLLPDGIVKPVIDATVQAMREQAQKTVKKSLDLNPNISPQTEANLNQAKP